MNQTIDLTTTLEIFTCPVCGIHYGMPPRFVDGCRQHGRAHYCPNGDSLTFGEGELEKARKELQRERQALDQEKARAKDLQKQRDLAQAAIKRLKKRVANGVCPCCKRSFGNLKRHIATKHPELLESQ